VGGLLLVRDFLTGSAATIISPLIIPFPLSTQASGGSRTVGLTNTVLEVAAILEVEATYPSSVLSDGHF
jgi:hypothetical protein